MQHTPDFVNCYCRGIWQLFWFCPDTLRILRCLHASKVLLNKSRRFKRSLSLFLCVCLFCVPLCPSCREYLMSQWPPLQTNMWPTFVRCTCSLSGRSAGTVHINTSSLTRIKVSVYLWQGTRIRFAASLLTWEHQSWVTDLQMWTVPNCTQSALFMSEQ